MDGTLTPLQRFFLAFVAFFSVLFNRRFAEEVQRVRERLKSGQPLAPAEGQRAAPAPPLTPAVPPLTPTLSPGRGEGEKVVARKGEGEKTGNLQVLALLQRDGRLLDFLEESLQGFSDAEIGAAARTVHEGCKKALDTYLTLEPVYREPEGASITVLAGFDPAAVRLTGNVVGAPPFKGSLRHHGWRAARAAFPPPPPHDPSILAPAEVEL
ncbi:MAG TPA: DUF2760 domain-containing protein [Anaeromyxobacteraceae bacterium]|nr:DUF2760 domain-containing protein [Anaeromyxobacteraceae bacterium]